MSSVPRSHRTTPLWVRITAALETSVVVQRGRMSALMKEAERKGEDFLTHRATTDGQEGPEENE
ncbi:MAG: hypothetical protein WCL38_08170 [Actinomycetota bacterium]